jgi:hypothetical protein
MARKVNKFPDHARLINVLAYVSKEPLEAFIPLDHQQIVEVLHENTHIHLDISGYGVSDLIRVGFDTPHHFYEAGYRATDLIADEGLLYGMLAHFHPTAIIQTFLRTSSDALLLTNNTLAHHELDVDLPTLLWRCVGHPGVAFEVVQRVVRSCAVVRSVPVDLLELCGIDVDKVAFEGIVAVRATPARE